MITSAYSRYIRMSLSHLLCKAGKINIALDDYDENE